MPGRHERATGRWNGSHGVEALGINVDVAVQEVVTIRLFYRALDMRDRMPAGRLARMVMDSVTHVVLGAALGEVVLGKKIGKQAMLWGAVAGSLPDLDIVVAPFHFDVLKFGVLTLDADASHTAFSFSLERDAQGRMLIRTISRRRDIDIRKMATRLWERIVGRPSGS